jgi:hypothetical protein
MILRFFNPFNVMLVTYAPNHTRKTLRNFTAGLWFCNLEIVIEITTVRKNVLPLSSELKGLGLRGG